MVEFNVISFFSHSTPSNTLTSQFIIGIDFQMIRNIFPHAADKTKIKNIKGDRVADWVWPKKCLHENVLKLSYPSLYLDLVISIIIIAHHFRTMQSNTHRYGYPSLSNWMDRNSNNEWLSISPLSMKFNEQPYLLKCVRVCHTLAVMRCTWNGKRMCLWQPVYVMCTYIASHTVFATQTNGHVVVYVCLFVSLLVPFLCEFAFRIGETHT